MRDLMPYIVTTKDRYPSQGDSSAPFGPIKSRRAVATLREAQKACYRIYRNAAYYAKVRTDNPAWIAVFAENWSPFWPSSEQGGSVSLPNGTMIEVAPVSIETLQDAIPASLIVRCGGPFRTGMVTLSAVECVVDAYNAAQGVPVKT